MLRPPSTMSEPEPSTARRGAGIPLAAAYGVIMPTRRKWSFLRDGNGRFQPARRTHRTEHVRRERDIPQVPPGWLERRLRAPRPPTQAGVRFNSASRSEERRVGKECSWRGARSSKKEKEKKS